MSNAGSIGEEDVGGGTVRYVEHYRSAAHRLGRSLDLGRGSGNERDLGSPLGESGGGGEPDPPPGSGDEGTAAIETKAGRLGQDQSASAFPA